MYIYILGFIFLGYINRVPCRSGMCTSPVQVTSSQLIASEIFPVPVVKAILYPGAIVNGLINNMTVPKWDNLLDLYNLTAAKEASALPDLQRLEVRLPSSCSSFEAKLDISVIAIKFSDSRICLKSWKMIENTINFYEKLKKEMSYLVRCSITVFVFPWNPILYLIGNRSFSLKK